jgi:chromosome segregation ATPase
MVKAYCGARKPRKNQKLGTAQECADTSQIRHYGLEQVSANLLKKLKVRPKKAPKPKKEPKPKKKPSPKKKPVPKKKHAIEEELQYPNAGEYIREQEEFTKKEIKVIEKIVDKEIAKLIDSEVNKIVDINEAIKDINADITNIENDFIRSEKTRDEFGSELDELVETFEPLNNKIKRRIELTNKELNELARITKKLDSLASEVEASVEENEENEESEESEEEGAGLRRKKLGGKSSINIRKGGKFINRDLRRGMNAIQEKALYGIGGCEDCYGGNFEQVLASALESNGGDFFFQQKTKKNLIN